MTIGTGCPYRCRRDAGAYKIKTRKAEPPGFFEMMDDVRAEPDG
jgi:hypothetical protein